MSYSNIHTSQNENSNLIFIVDDSKMYAMMLEHQLQKLTTYKSKVYLTGQECLENLSLKPDVIILDYSLPKMDGLEILQNIKKYNSEIPIIILSGQQELKIAIRMFKEGAVDYIIKDKDAVSKLVKSINKIFSKQESII